MDLSQQPTRKHTGARSSGRTELNSANHLKEQRSPPSASRKAGSPADTLILAFRVSKQAPSQVCQTFVLLKLYEKKFVIICSSGDFKLIWAPRMPLNITAPSVEKGIYAKKVQSAVPDNPSSNPCHDGILKEMCNADYHLIIWNRL